MSVSTLVSALAVSACLMPLGAQPAGVAREGGSAPIAASPIVEFKGVIREVHISRGAGSPYLEVRKEGATTRVYLGSIRYLISENFNPKSGQDVVVRGYQAADSVVAIEVTLPAEKKSLKLRDSQGWPLWRGGRRRFGQAALEN